MTAFRAGYKDGVQGRAYGWRNDDRWRDAEHDEYEDGFTSGADARAVAPGAYVNDHGDLRKRWIG